MHVFGLESLKWFSMDTWEEFMAELLPVVDGQDLPTFWGVPGLCVSGGQVVYSEPTRGHAAYLAYLKKIDLAFPRDTSEVNVYSAALIHLWRPCRRISNQKVCVF